MKTKLISRQKTALLCLFKHTWIALAATGGLIWVSSAQAQNVTGQSNLSNIPPAMTALYGDWGTATISDTATGFEVSAPSGTTDGGGAGYYSIPAGNQEVLNTNDTEAVLTLTINDTNTEGSVWTGMGFYVNDNVGAYQIGGYCGEFGYYGQFGPGSDTWNAAGTTVTEIADLPAALISTIQAGGDTINGITLEFYPAVYGGAGYDVTFNSLVIQPIPGTSLQITSSQYNAATGQFTLTWTSQASAQYTIQYSSNLTSGFTPLVTDIASGGTTTTYTVTAPAGSMGFFQVLQQ